MWWISDLLRQISCSKPRKEVYHNLWGQSHHIRRCIGIIWLVYIYILAIRHNTWRVLLIILNNFLFWHKSDKFSDKFSSLASAPIAWSWRCRISGFSLTFRIALRLIFWNKNVHRLFSNRNWKKKKRKFIIL